VLPLVLPLLRAPRIPQALRLPLLAVLELPPPAGTLRRYCNSFCHNERFLRLMNSHGDTVWPWACEHVSIRAAARTVTGEARADEASAEDVAEALHLQITPIL
jgi:hypothetical protein